MGINYVALISTLLLWKGMEAQEKVQTETGVKHQLAFVLGYTHIPSAFEEGNGSEAVFVPTVGVDYFIHFKEKWRIGVVVDYEFAKYLVDFNQEELKREGALITGILIGYAFAEKWNVLVGPGVELEKNKNIAVFRSGLEYEFELGGGWGLFPSANFDFKQEYSSYALNIGLSKLF